MSSVRLVAGGRMTSSNVRRGATDSSARRPPMPNRRAKGAAATVSPYCLGSGQSTAGGGERDRCDGERNRPFQTRQTHRLSLPGETVAVWIPVKGRSDERLSRPRFRQRSRCESRVLPGRRAPDDRFNISLSVGVEYCKSQRRFIRPAGQGVRRCRERRRLRDIVGHRSSRRHHHHDSDCDGLCSAEVTVTSSSAAVSRCSSGDHPERTFNRQSPYTGSEWRQRPADRQCPKPPLRSEYLREIDGVRDDTVEAVFLNDRLKIFFGTTFRTESASCDQASQLRQKKEPPASTVLKIFLSPVVPRTAYGTAG